MKLRIHFAECEHTGDLERYEDAVRRCGGKVLESGMVCHAYETGYVVAEITGDPKEFAKTLRADDWGGCADGIYRAEEGGYER